MKKILAVFAVVSVFLSGWPVALSAQASANAYNEIIHNFDVTAQLSEDRTLKIQENINYDFGSQIRHGIYRVIPESYERDGMNFKLNLKVGKVMRDGKEEPFTEMRGGNALTLKIGSADTEITGAHVYTIEYTTNKAINFFSRHTELYWNVTGNEWPVPIEQASFRLESPLGDSTSTMSFACYTGVPGSVETSCNVKPEDGGLVVRSERFLNEYEGMTVVFGFPWMMIKPQTRTELFWETLKDNWILVSPLLALIIMIYLWRTRGKDPEPDTIIPQYETPRGLHPMLLSAALGNGIIPPRGTTATIIQMARKGYLHIEYGTKKHLLGNSPTYTFIRKTAPPEEAPEWEKILWNGLFDRARRERSTFEELKKDAFYNDVQSATKKASKALEELHIFDANPYTVRILYIVAGGVVGWIVSIIGAGVAAGFGAGFVTFLIIAIFGWFMPRRTKEGAAIVAEVKGFKWFLSVTEEERLKFHNAPARTPEQFMEFLPAAIALGVEKEWAEQFKDLQLQPPDWAEGNAGSFSSVVLASAISDMGHASAAAVYSPPSSTAGGGGSGFSGGGSGGGFGGGGGGSW